MASRKFIFGLIHGSSAYPPLQVLCEPPAIHHPLPLEDYSFEHRYLIFFPM